MYAEIVPLPVLPAPKGVDAPAENEAGLAYQVPVPAAWWAARPARAAWGSRIQSLPASRVGCSVTASVKRPKYQLPGVPDNTYREELSNTFAPGTQSASE